MLRIITFAAIGAVIGWTIGKILNKIVESYNNYQIRKIMKRTETAITNAYAPIRELDQQRW